MTVSELAKQLNVKPYKIVEELFENGVYTTFNSPLSQHEIELVLKKYPEPQANSKKSVSGVSEPKNLITRSKTAEIHFSAVSVFSIAICVLLIVIFVALRKSWFS